MKKLFVFLMVFMSIFWCFSCTKKHTHEASSDWKNDAVNHWHTCSGCDELLDTAEHTFSEWNVVVEATASTAGTKKRACTVCNYEETQEIPKINHTHSYATTYSSNSTHHWLACSCGDKKDSALHTGGQATVDKLAVCEICGAEYGNYADHECEFVDGVCSCGKTEVGAFDKVIDGSFDDWTEDEKADALRTFGESGTGFGVNAYHKDGKAYFATTIITSTVNPHSFQIFQKDAQTQYILRYGGESNWYATNGSDYCIAASGTYKNENGLNIYTVESVWDFSDFPVEADGNYKINFSVVLPKPELSAASYSDTQQDYWVLYGRNAWDRAWTFVLTDTTKFEHSHVFSKEYQCVVCGASNELENLSVTLDGKIDDWSQQVVDTMLVSYDEEDRWIKQVGFTDDNYLYLYVSIAHREAVGTLNVVILGGKTWYEYGKIINTDVITLKGIDSIALNEYKDETGSFTVTDYEFVIALDTLSEVAATAITADGVRLGIDITNNVGEESYDFAIDNKTKMWGIAGYSSWNVNQHFIYGANGVPHKHDWDDEGLGCKLCDEPFPVFDTNLEIDGDFSDWSADIVATSSKTYGESGTGWEVMGYRDGTIVYFGVTIKTAGGVPALFSFVERGSEGFKDHQVRYIKGVWEKCAGVLLLGSTLDDTDTIDTYQLELICDLSELNPLASGDYLFGLDVNVPGEASAASFSDAKPEYWVMFGRNAWESDQKMFTVTANGITHNHILGQEFGYDEQHHWKSCACGYMEKTNHQFGNEYLSDSDNHWLECECGYMDKEAHHGGQATNEKLAICEDCGRAYGEIEGHTHAYETKYDAEYHWTECLCGSSTAKRPHRGGEATSTSQAICDSCGQPYGDIIDYAINLDGYLDDWPEAVKANVLKGWYKDSDGRTRGLEYMAYVDDKYVYLYTKTITASDAAKGFDILFNVDGKVSCTGLYLYENIVNYYCLANNPLDNGLYETVTEIIIDKSVYVNASGDIYLGVWFMGCDDAFAPLSWHETNKTTIWGLNNKCPWNKNMSHQKVTETGFDHYHDVDENNVCGWCQETIELGITVDGDSSDWSEDILATGISSTGKNGMFVTAYVDDTNVYLYLEITQLGTLEANYISIFASNSNVAKIRKDERFSVCYDLGTTDLKPYGDDVFIKYAMMKKTNLDGKSVACMEIVVDKKLFVNQLSTDPYYGQYRFEVQIDDMATWKSGQNWTGWKMALATKDGLHSHNYVTKFDEDYHWTECLCGSKTEKVEHFGGLATATELAICEGCGQAYGELSTHEHSYEMNFDSKYHWEECSCGDVKAKEAHKGGEADAEGVFICEVCEQPYVNNSDFAITLDGNTSDWTEEQKANILKGWYKDSNGETRGIEYMAFIDEKYVYVYTRSITASNAVKSVDIIFNVNQERPSINVSSNGIGSNGVDYYFVENTLLDNGLFETVSEVVIDKASYLNSQGNIYLAVWFNGCDDSFAPLSWHEANASTVWVLNHRSPWFVYMSHQKVTETGFDHYHDLMDSEDNTCGWCQEKISLGITVDGDASDWKESVLATGITSTTKNNVFTTAYIDDEFLYMYIEITQIEDVAPDYITIFDKNSANINGIRQKERFDLVFDNEGIRPYCPNKTLCQYNYCDCNNGFAKMAMIKKVNESGQNVYCIELVIDKILFINQNPTDANYGKCRYEIQMGPNLTPNQNISDWKMMVATEEGLA